MQGIILLYGPDGTGKSEFVKRVKGILKEYNDDNSLESFPTIYVTNIKPDNTQMFDFILRFSEEKEAIFEKGFAKLTSS